MLETGFLGQNKSSILWFFVFITIGPFGASLQGQARMESELDSLVTVGIDLSMKQQYDDAEHHFQTLSKRFPNSPACPLFLAGAHQARAIGYYEEVDQQRFDSLLASAHILIESTKLRNASLAYYYEGLMYGMQSYERVHRGETLKGYLRARSSVSAFTSALEHDSTFHDATVGIGVYLYWKSRKLEFLHWLPFVRDDRIEGITMLERAVSTAHHQRYSALSNLLWIYLDTQDNEKALLIAARVLEQYPSNCVFLRGKAKAYFNMMKYTEARGVYERLLSIVLQVSVQNNYFEIACRVDLAQVMLALNDPDQARMHLSLALSKSSTSIPEAFQKSYDDYLALARRLLHDKRSSASPAER
jgi:tetratricopeptide (TPR) repeat protein